MCGIAGYITKEKPTFDAEEILLQMTTSMTHRGPDDAGCELLRFEDGLGLTAFGQRRLSIIDLSPAGHQPMFTRDRDLCITLNGEIYNYVELREELCAKGYEFFSSSDTEVLLNAYREWGTDCFARFNGMWALAIHDKRKRKIILSRDRYGKKPLYYFKSENEFVFASEIKAILRFPNVPKEPNYEKLFRYLSGNYRHVDIDNDSFYADIFQIPKSSVVELNEDLEMTTETYWRLEENVKFSGDISDERAIEEFRDLFIDSVKIRLRSDVPVGCMLSGGMDSTSITCVAYNVLKQPIRTFSGITGEEKGIYDESEFIDAVVESTNADHHYIKPDPSDIVKTVNEMLDFHDEPICTVTWYNLYLIARKIREQSITVVLNGHGGDEVVAGYWDYYHYHFFDLLRAGETEELAREQKAWQENHGRDTAELARYREYIPKIESGQLSEMSRFPDYSAIFHEDIVAEYKRNISIAKPFETWLAKRMYSDLMFETVPASLRPEDRNTMAFSIESRSPMLDYRLAEYAFGLPGRLKMRDGVGKWILREAMRGILPEKVRTRKDKTGFVAPADEWFRTVNKEDIQELINDEEMSKLNIFNVERLNEVFAEHCSREKNHAMFLWQFLNAALWLKKNFLG